MTIQHRDIPDAERHEPKGITTATSGEVYVANGDTLSGVWKPAPIAGATAALTGQILRATGTGVTEWVYPPEGWGTYQNGEVVPADGLDSQSIGTTYTKLLANGAGSATVLDQVPWEIRGTAQLWDTTTSLIKPINAFDFYNIRIDLPIVGETGSPVELTMQMDIGTDESAPAIPIVTRYATTGKTTPYTLSFYFGFYTGATYLANSGRLFLKTNTGTVTVQNANITLTRLSSGAL